MNSHRRSGDSHTPPNQPSPHQLCTHKGPGIVNNSSILGRRQCCISLLCFIDTHQTLKPLWSIISTFAREIQTSLPTQTFRVTPYTSLCKGPRWQAPWLKTTHQRRQNINSTYIYVRMLPLKTTYSVRTPPTLVFQGPWKPDFYAQLTCAAVVIATEFPTWPSHELPLQRTTLLCALGITLE